MASDPTNDISEPPHASSGGGPLRSIADDPERRDSERELAEALIGWLRQRQAMHGRQIDTGEGVSLSVAQVKLLFHLPAHGAMRAGNFAAAADLTPAAASQALDALERAGVIERSRSTTDRRSVNVGLTALGRRVLKTVRSNFQARWDAHVATIDAADLAAANRALRQVLRVFAPSDQDG